MAGEFWPESRLPDPTEKLSSWCKSPVDANPLSCVAPKLSRAPRIDEHMGPILEAKGKAMAAEPLLLLLAVLFEERFALGIKFELALRILCTNFPPNPTL